MMKHSVLLTAILALAVASCTPVPIATPTPVATSTLTATPPPTSTPMATATVTVTPEPTIEGLEGVPYPDKQILTEAIRSYALAMGLGAEKVEVSYKEFDDRQGNHLVFAVSQDNTPLLIADRDPKTKEWIWEEATLRKLGSVAIPIGGDVTLSDDYRNVVYQETAVQQLNFVSATFAEQWWHYGGPDHWTDFAIEHNMPLAIRTFWGSTDVYPSELKTADRDAVKAFIQGRTRKILSLVKKLNENHIPVQIEFANEPTYYYQGIMHWMGEYPDDFFWLFLYSAFRDKWITETYVQLYQIATTEFGLVPGKDFTVIGIVERGIELPGPRTDYITALILRTKQEIADKLGIAQEKVPFDVGIEFHLGKTATDKNIRDVTVPFDQLDPVVIADNLQNIARKTGSRIFITEMDALADEESEMGKAYAKVILAATKSGVVENIAFFLPLSYQPAYGPWGSHLFEPNYKKGIVYYLTLRGLLEATSSK